MAAVITSRRPSPLQRRVLIVLAEQRATAILVLPLVPVRLADDAAPQADELPVELDGIWHMACRGDYVIRLDGTTCLQL